MNLQELVYSSPSGNDVAWEDLSDKEWNNVSHYRGKCDSLYLSSLEEQFMFLCFVTLSEYGDF